MHAGILAEEVDAIAVEVEHDRRGRAIEVDGQIAAGDRVAVAVDDADRNRAYPRGPFCDPMYSKLTDLDLLPTDIDRTRDCRNRRRWLRRASTFEDRCNRCVRRTERDVTL